jgi:hypothetical protein
MLVGDASRVDTQGHLSCGAVRRAHTGELSDHKFSNAVRHDDADAFAVD